MGTRKRIPEFGGLPFARVSLRPPNTENLCAGCATHRNLGQFLVRIEVAGDGPIRSDPPKRAPHCRLRVPVRTEELETIQCSLCQI